MSVVKLFKKKKCSHICMFYAQIYKGDPRPDILPLCNGIISHGAQIGGLWIS